MHAFTYKSQTEVNRGGIKLSFPGGRESCVISLLRHLCRNPGYRSNNTVKFLLKAAFHHKEQFWMATWCIRHQTLLLFANTKRDPSAVTFYGDINKNI